MLYNSADFAHAHAPTLNEQTRIYDDEINLLFRLGRYENRSTQQRKRKLFLLIVWIAPAATQTITVNKIFEIVTMPLAATGGGAECKHCQSLAAVHAFVRVRVCK